MKLISRIKLAAKVLFSAVEAEKVVEAQAGGSRALTAGQVELGVLAGQDMEARTRDLMRNTEEIGVNGPSAWSIGPGWSLEGVIRSSDPGLVGGSVKGDIVGTGRRAVVICAVGAKTDGCIVAADISLGGEHLGEFAADQAGGGAHVEITDGAQVKGSVRAKSVRIGRARTAITTESGAVAA